MLYEKYKIKIEKIARVCKKIWGFRYVIFSILMVALLSTGAFLATKGKVSDKIDCPPTVVYGEELNYKAKGLFSNIFYQYSTDPSFSTYSEEAPRIPGTYYVRAASKGSFKSVKYGNVYQFTILKKAVDVTIVEDSWTYGDTPTITASLP